MIYPSDFEKKLGFNKIIEQLKAYCLSETAADNIENTLQFTAKKNLITEKIEQTAEFVEILRFADSFPGLEYYELTSELARLKIQDSYLFPENIQKLQLSLQSIINIQSFFSDTEEKEYPRLENIVFQMHAFSEIIQKTKEIINEKAEILDNASTSLAEIRQELKKEERKKEKEEKNILQQLTKKGLVDTDVDYTVRNNRLVIPVKANKRKEVPGYTHDSSATGQTVYVEPAVLFDINNQIVSLLAKEKQEIIRILKDFARFIRPDIDALIQNYQFLIALDHIRAKAKYAIATNSVKIRLEDTQKIDWKQARHPLLEAHLKKQQKEIVASDILLDKNQRILIISGPNAGGKSVCLQTVALLQYCLQCGLLIPVKEDSSSGLFSAIFLDIGDDQSIENDLSTYSSHLINMKFFCEHAKENSLFFIDEFGGGTDPQIGGAMAESILEKLYEKGSFGIITTHYSNLKVLPQNYAAMQNAAMLFDQKNIQPLFLLESGKPGSSFAYEIAHSIALPSEIIEAAKEKTGISQLNFEKELQTLEEEKRLLKEKIQKYTALENSVAALMEEYKEKNALIEDKRKAVLQAAKMQAEKILDSANKQIEQTIFEIKQTKADKEKTKKLRTEIQKEKERLHEINTKDKPTHPTPIKQSDFTIGDNVRIISNDAKGTILEIRKKEILVGFGDVKIAFPPSDVEKTAAEKKTEIQKKYGKILDEINAKKAVFNPQIDIRGMRVEEALILIDKYLDDAVLLGINHLRILHGKGSGALRSAIREQLNLKEEVKRCKDEHVEQGGQGITLVELSY